MAASQMSVFNKALRWLEERSLASLSEQREPVRLLNNEWQDAVQTCLEKDYWKHAIRESQFSPDVNRTPNFGFLWAFTKPTDWVSTFQVSDNPAYDPLHRRFTDQNNVWYADSNPLYVRYVSNDPDYGWNLALWRAGFTEYVAAYLAWLLAPRTKQWQQKVDAIEKILRKAEARAIAQDAMQGPPGKPPYGTWVTSRAPRGGVYPFGMPFPNGDD